MGRQIRLSRMAADKWSFRFGNAGGNVVVLSDEDVALLRVEVDRVWEEGKKRELEEVKNNLC